MELTDYHAKYFAHDLTRLRRGDQVDRISQSLFDASVDLNPHQIDAALFALSNPLSKGVILADEVGLGKTIEAALVISQYWAERRRRLIIVCPAALRKQWASELSEKFHLPSQILDAKTWRLQRKKGMSDPFDQSIITIVSYNFAARMSDSLRLIPWDLVVLDEAHKLRNAHRDSHRTGQAIKAAFGASNKLLLTATPLQNSLMELYGLSTVIDSDLFGDAKSFRYQYLKGESDLDGLRARTQAFVKRTLRKDVLEYIRYTERKALTVPFTPSEDEQRLYRLVSGYLQREGSYGIPFRQKHLITLIARKLLASSTSAIIRTLETIIARLRNLEESHETDASWLDQLIGDEEFDSDLAEEALEVRDSNSLLNEPHSDNIDREKLAAEIAELKQYLDLAHRITEDAKSKALLQSLETGFRHMIEMGAEQKAVVFTESCRTQSYLSQYLERNGYQGAVATVNGSNNDTSSNAIYQRWLRKNQGSEKVTGSPAVDRRTAVIDHFRDEASILIATEAASEGVNLQFCSLVVNYDLPWNPQRVEQRIGRCHRYGQKFDVVVINFLNQRNEVDRRVLELLSDKFHLFNGLFGASDEVLGKVESGVDFEQRITNIYRSCRSDVEIERAFNELQRELEDSINQEMLRTQEKLLEHFDAKIHDLLKIKQEQVSSHLDRMTQRFWHLTKHQLNTYAEFDDEHLTFRLAKSPVKDIAQGNYILIRKDIEPPKDSHLYRLSHPLGEFVLDKGRRLSTADATLCFYLRDYKFKLSALERFVGQSGLLELNLLALDSFQKEEHLVFTGLTDDNQVLDQEQCELLFKLSARVAEVSINSHTKALEYLESTVDRQLEARLSRLLDENNQYFQKERDKLDAWAEEQLLSAEQQLNDTRIEIKEAKRKTRQAETVEEQQQAQSALKQLEKKQRRQRREIFDVEDQIEARRDQLIGALEKQMHRHSSSHRLFRIRWQLV
ncbi:SNF2-related protein [Salinivibrio kushneri]|uniref:SNF2-related protein n=1 Tax=Salinivibrio kushneri TaxID=1908198 RepID=UPI0022B37E97|nr:SNF2-related protein [Salinivibrio kushneri]WBA11809.1 SNF2-related protein [Salinivibrio kushneri]